MKLRNLWPNNVKIWIKNGWTVADFCQKCGCTKEELYERIGKIFTTQKTSQQVWNDILANGKKNRPKQKGKKPNPNVAGTPREEGPTTEPETVEEATEPTATNLNLEELRRHEDEQSAKVIELEKLYGALSTQRYELRKAFMGVCEEMAELKKAYQTKGHEAERIAQEDGELVSQMNKIAAEYRQERGILEEIRASIAEQSKISIFVYEDGQIATNEAEGLLDDSGHEELFANLREQEEAEDFRPKDLRVVARVIQIVTHLSVQFEIIFENGEVERGFEIFRKE